MRISRSTVDNGIGPPEYRDKMAGTQIGRATKVAGCVSPVIVGSGRTSTDSPLPGDLHQGHLIESVWSRSARAEFVVPLTVEVMRALRLQVQRNGNDGSPRVSGSTNCSRAVGQAGLPRGQRRAPSVPLARTLALGLRSRTLQLGDPRHRIIPELCRVAGNLGLARPLNVRDAAVERLDELAERGNDAIAVFVRHWDLSFENRNVTRLGLQIDASNRRLSHQRRAARVDGRIHGLAEPSSPPWGHGAWHGFLVPGRRRQPPHRNLHQPEEPADEEVEQEDVSLASVP